MYMFEKKKNGQAVSPAETVLPEGSAPSGTESPSETERNGGAENGGGCYSDGGTARESLAMVYSPRQYWRDAYSPAEALDRGTLFRELDKPLTGVCVDGGGDCA